jgi:enolase
VSRFHGRGVRQAVSYVTSILLPIFQQRQFFEQKELDLAIAHADGTPNFKKIGVNTAIATSAALAMAATQVLRQPLFRHLSKKLVADVTLTMPRPAFAVFAVTVPGPISRVFLLPSATAPLEDQIRVIGEIFLHYEQAMHCPVCNNGCFPLEISSLDDILAAVEIAASGGGHTLGDDVFLGFAGGPTATVDFWMTLFEVSPFVVYVEDPQPFSDAEGWARIMDIAGDKATIAMGAGISSKFERIARSLPCNAVVLRPIQAGTLLAVADAAAACERASKKWIIAVSERETGDSWICDLAVAVGASILQLGAVCRGENIVKLNRLLEISKELETPEPE